MTEPKEPTPSSAQAAHLGDRVARAAKIIQQPGKYKVCEGCDSIVGSHVVHCPNCAGYRFDGDKGAVVQQAKRLASREQTSVSVDDLF